MVTDGKPGIGREREKTVTSTNTRGTTFNHFFNPAIANIPNNEVSSVEIFAAKMPHIATHILPFMEKGKLHKLHTFEKKMLILRGNVRAAEGLTGS